VPSEREAGCMTKALSIDLRERVVAVIGGHS
jgi:hypothetical protein